MLARVQYEENRPAHLLLHSRDKQLKVRRMQGISPCLATYGERERRESSQLDARQLRRTCAEAAAPVLPVRRRGRSATPHPHSAAQSFPPPLRLLLCVVLLFCFVLLLRAAPAVLTPAWGGGDTGDEGGRGRGGRPAGPAAARPALLRGPGGRGARVQPRRGAGRRARCPAGAPRLPAPGAAALRPRTRRGGAGPARRGGAADDAKVCARPPSGGCRRASAFHEAVRGNRHSGRLRIEGLLCRLTLSSEDVQADLRFTEGSDKGLQCIVVSAVAEGCELEKVLPLSLDLGDVGRCWSHLFHAAACCRCTQIWPGSPLQQDCNMASCCRTVTRRSWQAGQAASSGLRVTEYWSPTSQLVLSEQALHAGRISVLMSAMLLTWQAGIRPGQRLLALSDPVRNSEMWKLDKPNVALSRVRDAIRLRRAPTLDLILSAEPVSGAAAPQPQSTASAATGSTGLLDRIAGGALASFLSFITY